MSSDSASRNQTSQSGQEVTPLSAIPWRVFQSQSPGRTNSDHTSVVNQDGTLLSEMPERVLDNMKERQRSDNNEGGTSDVNQEEDILAAIPEKMPDCLQLSQSSNSETQEGRNSSRILPYKPSEDGYNWRKYGQKLVKGNEFTRSYYRCTHPNCPAKRQVERLQGVHTTSTVYLGKHDHLQPQASPQMDVGFVLPDEASLAAIGEDKSSNSLDPTSHHAESAKCPMLAIIPPRDVAVEGVISQTNNTTGAVDDGVILDSKRQKIDITNFSAPLLEKPNGKPRVVQTMSGVDIVNDGYRWRKYGQKFVKGNANPRSYYRCSNAGCPVKKHVERASHDTKVVLTTYEGQHVHDMPLARTVTVNTAGAKRNLSSLNGESTSRPEENSAGGLQLVVHTTTANSGTSS